jgi:cytochrome c oxidase subunit IV
MADYFTCAWYMLDVYCLIVMYIRRNLVLYVFVSCIDSSLHLLYFVVVRQSIIEILISTYPCPYSSFMGTTMIQLV